MTITSFLSRVSGVIALVLGVAAPARGQDCATIPLLGHRAALGLGYAHAGDETGASASGALGIGTHQQFADGFMADLETARRELRTFVPNNFVLAPLKG